MVCLISLLLFCSPHFSKLDSATHCCEILIQSNQHKFSCGFHCFTVISFPLHIRTTMVQQDVMLLVASAMCEYACLLVQHVIAGYIGLHGTVSILVK
jgi:hypothetical protein